MVTIELDEIQMLALSIVVLFVGMYLTSKFKLLEDNYIPPAVTGGLIFSLVTWGFHSFASVAFEFDMQLRDRDTDYVVHPLVFPHCACV